MNQPDFLRIGQQKGYIHILNDGATIHYVAPDKKYRFTTPKEKVRVPARKKSRPGGLSYRVNGIVWGVTKPF